MAYDANNVFAKILRGEIPCKTIIDTKHALSFHDIAPAAPVHALVIPRGAFVDAADFYSRASVEEITGYTDAITKTLEALGLKTGFRLISNNGVGAGQTVFHFHTHILAGKPMHALLAEGE